MASIILEHSPSGIVPGLNDYYAEDGTPLHPPVGKVFWSFRVMVGTGMLMLALVVLGQFLSRRDAVTSERWHIDRLPRIALYGFVAMTFSGWVATLAGGTTEIGRQPWLVTGVLTTEAAVADVPAPMVLTTLIAYLAVYAALLVIYIGTLTYLCGKAARGGICPNGSADGAPFQGKANPAATPAE